MAGGDDASEIVARHATDDLPGAPAWPAAPAADGTARSANLVAAGIMFVAWVSLVMAVGLLRELVHAGCSAAGLPPWEAGIITWLLAMPVDLVISAGIESGLMGARFGKGVELWYTQRLIQLSIIAVIGLIIGLVVLIRQLT